MSTWSDRDHRCFNLYDSAAIETVEEAVSEAMNREDCDRVGDDALRVMADFFLTYHHLFGHQNEDLIHQSIDLAHEEERVDSEGDALAEVAAAYIGYSIEE